MNWIKKGRKELNMSVNKFSEMIGVSRFTLWRWETDRSKPSRMAEKFLKKIFNNKL